MTRPFLQVRLIFLQFFQAEIRFFSIPDLTGEEKKVIFSILLNGKTKKTG